MMTVGRRDWKEDQPRLEALVTWELKKLEAVRGVP